LKLDSPGWVWPVPVAPDGRTPRISDGFHRAGDMSVRAGVGHRGQDVMFRKRWPTAPRHPWSSRWYEMLPHIPALAAQEGVVVRCGRLDTGWHVIVDHGDGVGTGYHHLSELLDVQVGSHLRAGQPLGIVGGSPVGYGLVHLHFDVAVDGRFIDAAKPMRRWSYLTLSDAWRQPTPLSS
jgi:murein DD-endopeptidase MepM/ murein hydrolase activator NlpD